MRHQLITIISIFFSIAFISPAIGQTHWFVSTTGNNANSGTTVASAWRSIQFANDASVVNSGDTIFILAGAYTEYINITKSLKIFGPNYNISPNPGIAGRMAEAIIHAPLVSTTAGLRTVFDAFTPGTNIQLKGLKMMDGCPVKSGHEARNPVQDIEILFEKNWVSNGGNIFIGTLTRWKKVKIIDNFFENINLTTNSSAIKLNDAKEDVVAPNLAPTVIATITDNRIEGTTWAGIICDNLLSATILRNKVKRVRETGIKLAGEMAGAIVSDNEIDSANTDATDVGAFYIYGTEFSGPTYFTNNHVRNSHNGFSVRVGENLQGKNIHLNNNSFDSSNTGFAINHKGSGILDATCNWIIKPNYLGASSKVFGPVHFVPFLSKNFDAEPLTPGFQPGGESCNVQGSAPFFTRTVLTSGLERPWEIIYGKDNMLWITQRYGRVSRVDPNSGIANTVYTAPDYYAGDPAQAQVYACDPGYAHPVSSGTYGMALHPEFPFTPYVYFIYSYNAAVSGTPLSKYKVRRLTWDTLSKTVIAATDIIYDLPLEHYHEGMRMMTTNEGGQHFIYITTGDGTIDDDRCYPAGNNANLKAQDWSSKFGKTLRYNINGSIPTSNPIAGSSVYTSGHRNALGLAFNPGKGIVYSSENGKSTDDEINIIEKGKNYGWPKTRGYHSDNNYPGEASFVASYLPSFMGDELRSALYAWSPANVSLPEDPQVVSRTGVVAPSGMLYYGTGNVAAFQNSLLVTSLKNTNPHFRSCVYVFKLTADGNAIDNNQLNPQVYFAEQNPPTLRYRSITSSGDGNNFYIITDSWDGVNNKILKFSYAPTVYTFIGSGNWNVASNWTNNQVPPSQLPAGSEIIVDPVAGNCILNIPVTIMHGGKISVKAGKSFVVQGNLAIQ